MKNNEVKRNIDLAVKYCEEIKDLISSVSEDVSDSHSMTEAWNKIDKFYRDIESMRNKQKCTSSKSFPHMTNNIDCKGHTKYLQGLNLPIMINSIAVNDNELNPSPVSEMHIATVDGVLTLLITPEIISI